MVGKSRRTVATANPLGASAARKAAIVSPLAGSAFQLLTVTPVHEVCPIGLLYTLHGLGIVLRKITRHAGGILLNLLRFNKYNYLSFFSGKYSVTPSGT